MGIARNEADERIAGGPRMAALPEVLARCLAALLRIEDQQAAILEALRAAPERGVVRSRKAA